jgi:uncharacterized protein (DUF1684 family)
MRKLLAICLLACLAACSEGKRPLAGESEYQRKLNAEYKDASTSPLKKKDLKNFRGLDFFPVDSSYVVTAKLNRTPDAPFFEMATTDERRPLYREFGTVDFTLKGRNFSLTLYQSQEEMFDPRYKDYLFLPFTDDTSGEESYGGGRYMNLYLSKIQPDETIVLNFNNTYNPYCVYNDKYSCPLVPRKNYLDIAVRAGIKDFKKEE